ncbi:YgiT-type zinc finger protein [Nocardioides massiliensis]|uniref:YgiT-type zinc finger domain-containing protein n=1 Tax=Nocardioides massiliensis TaxID=1325935 RepID=A0ABT9NQK1_9ACTN|nr:YgiT-type zinc finger protein [Nocardioides massiliensis]MDP9822658.1 YgiT-type zinc finger domain-containing protein [Nocardioides massiliensis]
MADVGEFPCVECGSSAVEVLRPHAVDRHGKLVVIRDVPMYECGSCGEVYLTPAVMKELDALVARLIAGGADEAIVHYQAA